MIKVQRVYRNTSEHGDKLVISEVLVNPLHILLVIPHSVYNDDAGEMQAVCRLRWADATETMILGTLHDLQRAIANMDDNKDLI